MIDLELMRAQWAPQDGGLYLAAIDLHGAKSSLRRMAIFTSLQLAAWGVCVLFLGNYVHTHIGWNRLAAAGIVLDVYAIAMLAALIGQIALARSIDYNQPPVAIQQRLAAIRILRIRTTQWAVLAGTAAWTPFVVLVLGQFAYRAELQVWLIANLVFSFAIIPFVVAIAKKYGEQFAQSPFFQKLADDLAGRNLNDATAFVAQLNQFKREL